jgi:HPt (histidine-containing phosphotransfer) domain-containing protein
MQDPPTLSTRILDDLLRVGGEAFVRELFGGLDDLAPDLIRKASACLADGDAAGVRAHVHNLKGVAANLGALPLAQAAERALTAVVEESGADAALADLRGRWAELRVELLARGFIAGP